MGQSNILAILALVAYFSILLLVVLKDHKNEDIKDYFFAGRKLPFWALSITFIASWWGAGSAISTADLAFDDGMGAFWYYGMPVLVSTFFMILMSKKIRENGSLTQGEMFKKRYDKKTSVMLAFMILIFMTVTAASQMVGIGQFFGNYLGFNYELAVIIGTSIVLIYSMFGGFKGVVITDIVQFIFLASSAFIILGVALYNAGGFTGISNWALSTNNASYTSFFSGSKKYMPYVITFGAAWMIQANVWQRISATRNTKDARKMTILSFWVYIPLYLSTVLIGMAGAVIYPKLPEGGIISALVADYMTPVVGTIIFVGITSAIMSTMDSLINTGAMTFSVDIYKEVINPRADEKKLLFISKMSTCLITLVAVLISLKIRSILKVSWIASDIISTGVFVPLILGFFWRKGTSLGAFCSMITGGLFCLYNYLYSIGIKLPMFWEQGSTVGVLVGMGLCFIVYVSTSLFFNNKSEIEVKKSA